MKIVTRANALAACQRSPLTPARHEWYAMPLYLVDGAPEPVAFYCKYCLFVMGQKLFDEMG